MSIQAEVDLITKSAACTAAVMALAGDEVIPATARLELLDLLATVALVLRTDPMAVITMFKAAADVRLGGV